MARKQHKYHFTYKTVNLINGKYYVGMHSTSNLEDGYLGSGKRFRYSLNKYGKENFKREILQFFESKEKLIEGEIELVNDSMLQDPLCMNLKGGGTGGIINEEHHLKMRKGCSKYVKELWKDPKYQNKMKKLWAKRLKQAHKDGKYNYGISFKGKHHSKEAKKAIGEKNSLNKKGLKNPVYGTIWMHHLKLRKNKMVKSNEIEKNINDGWIKGRKIKFE